MNEYTGDNLISLFEKLNIETGNINQNTIRGWFDTDSEELLSWICANITEENYVSAQENLEYLNSEVNLTSEELEVQMQSLEQEFPGIFQHEENLFKIETAADMIEMLEGQLEDCDHQLKGNQDFHQLLSMQVSKLSSEEMKSQTDKEAAQQVCSTLASKLDKLNCELFEHIIRYQNVLNNYDFVQLPEFKNNVDITSCINSMMRVESEVLDDTVSKSFGNALADMQNRLFHSKRSNLVLQMRIETLNHLLTFLDNFKICHLVLVQDRESIEKDINFNKDQQDGLLKFIEDLLVKQAEEDTSQCSLGYYKNELISYQSKLDNLVEVKKIFANMLSYFVTMYNLYEQEKADINFCSQSFRNGFHYIQDSILRKDGMLNIIQDYEKYSSSMENNLNKLIQYCGLLVTEDSNSTVNMVAHAMNSVRNEIHNLEKKHFSNVRTVELEQDLMRNIRNLLNFLICGPTCRIVSIPHPLQLLLSDVDLNLNAQSASVKSIVQMRQKRKEKLAKDKWLNYRRQLWMNFILDPTRMFKVLQEVNDAVNL